MGIWERKEREKLERKALIVRCAKELILEYGADGVSMGSIAKKAELSKATIYLYFPSKDKLFREICVEAGDRFINYYQSRITPEMSTLDSIKLYWDCYLDMFGKSDDIIMLFQMKHFLTPEYPFFSVEEAENPGSGPAYGFFNMIREQIEKGIAEGIFQPDVNPPLASHTILSLFSMIVASTARVHAGNRAPPGPDALESDKTGWWSASREGVNVAMIDDMKNVFQVVLRGIARDGIDKSLLILGSRRDHEAVEDKMILKR
ncbi:MAG: TetR/AcrR family transcriptional regulator [Treponema sp.]|jgi:AcrR family transcriptional regulator|nr:TetR/AcrR family transcriptional regulator [Treponema sp.]